MRLTLYYCLHFNDEETENFPMFVQPVVVKPEENPRQADPRAQALYHLAGLPGVGWHLKLKDQMRFLQGQYVDKGERTTSGSVSSELPVSSIYFCT